MTTSSTRDPWPAVIRRAAPGESVELTALALRSKAVWGYDVDFMRSASEELAITEDDIGRRDLFVAEVGGAPAGVAGVAHEADPPELDFLFVDPNWKGSGIGKALLRAALVAARRRGLAELAIVSDPNAEPFYLSQGAIRVGAQRSPSTGRQLPVMRISTHAI